MTVLSLVNILTAYSGMNWRITEATVPNPTAIAIEYFIVFLALSGFFAPMFCAAIAETVASIAEGTMNSSPMNFSTIPTAAASFSPLPFAITVMAMNAIWMKPSWSEIGTPVLSIPDIVRRSGLRS